MGLVAPADSRGVVRGCQGVQNVRDPGAAAGGAEWVRVALARVRGVGAQGSEEEAARVAAPRPRRGCSPSSGERPFPRLLFLLLPIE